MCFKKYSPTPIKSETIVQQGVDDLQAYADAGVVLQNAGAGLFKESGAQAVLPDGTKTPIFRKGSNTTEKKNLLAYLEANHSDILNQASATDLGEDKTTVTKDEDTGDVTVTVETVGGDTGQKTLEAADTETVEGLNAAIEAMQSEIESLKGDQQAAKEAAVAAALAAATEEEKKKAAESGATIDTEVDSAANAAAVAAAEAAASEDITTKSAATQFGDMDVLTEGKSTLLDPDIKTLDPVKPVGITSVVYKTIVEREPSEAVKLQEQIAREELRRARVDRAIQKRSLMRRRIEASAQVGAGRIVRSGQEVELDIGEPTAAIARAAGMRGGRGRGSLITGSRGGIGFYSRFS